MVLKRGGGGARLGLKKGPWTAAEDAILGEYVRKNGEGNWNAVQRNCGLLRCGKSCRLRWANHLRPNLKKGAFSIEEERLIIELHAKLGNKWARMASQLPGRTDNEIKNYWNTRAKRRLRVGLPIYPPEIAQFHQTQPEHQDQKQPNSKTENSPIFSDNPENQFKLFLKNNSGGFNLNPLSSSYIASPWLTMFHQNLPITAPSFQFNQTIPAGPTFHPTGNLVLGCTETEELPSIQLPLPEATTPTFSGSTCRNGDESVMANSGLLGDLLAESRALRRSEKAVKEEEVEDEFEKQCELECGDSSSAYSSNGLNMKAKNQLSESINSIDDELSSLLDNFPLTVPVPDWYDASGNVSSNDRQSSNATEGNLGLEREREGSVPQVVSTSARVNHNWALGSGCWNNMPGIC